MILTLSIREAINHAPRHIQAPLKELFKDLPERMMFMADETWTRSRVKPWNIKVSEKNYEYLAKQLGKSKNLPSFKVEFENYPLMFIKFRSQAAVAATRKTQMQELGSAWIMRRVLRDNKRYSDWKDIKRDPKYKELIDIYPFVDDDPTWLKTFYAQQKIMIEKYSDVNFTEFNRDGGFMDFISSLIRVKYKISQKDVWNPSDIWLIYRERDVKAAIERATKGSSITQSINELNAIMRNLFREKRLVGLSLKKVSGIAARYKEYNISDNDLPRDFTYDLVEIRTNMNVDGTGIFETKDTRIIVEGYRHSYAFQIKADQKGFSNLKFEPSQFGASAGRLGKTPVDKVRVLTKEYGMAFENDHKLYPKTLAEFNSEEDDYKKRLLFLSQKGVILSTSAKEAINSIKRGLASKDKPTAHSKIMQINFVYHLLMMQPEKVDEFLTDMIYLSKRKGKEFGPFAKIY